MRPPTVLLKSNTVSSLNPRNRMVVFRLTQEEYVSLQEACKRKGGRNLSEFTRSELLSMVGPETAAGIFQEQFDELQRRLVDLESKLAQLAELVAGALQTLPVFSRGEMEESNG